RRRVAIDDWSSDGDSFTFPPQQNAGVTAGLSATRAGAQRTTLECHFRLPLAGELRESITAKMSRGANGGGDRCRRGARNQLQTRTLGPHSPRGVQQQYAAVPLTIENPPRAGSFFCPT